MARCLAAVGRFGSTLPGKSVPTDCTGYDTDGQAGIDDIISLVPLYGDIASGILQLYQVWLSFIFGVPLNLIGWMVSLRAALIVIHDTLWTEPDISC